MKRGRDRGVITAMDKQTQEGNRERSSKTSLWDIRGEMGDITTHLLSSTLERTTRSVTIEILTNCELLNLALEKTPTYRAMSSAAERHHSCISSTKRR